MIVGNFQLANLSIQNIAFCYSHIQFCHTYTDLYMQMFFLVYWKDYLIQSSQQFCREAVILQIGKAKSRKAS